MITSLVISAVPGTPQGVSAIKVIPPSEDDCIIVINWNPPSNVNTSLVKQYMVESPSGNQTTTAIAVALLIHHCVVGSDTHVRIHAIDSCDRNGFSSDNVISELLEASSNSSGIVTTQDIVTPTTSGLRELNSDTMTV